MNSVERLKAAITKLQKMGTYGTDGPWHVGRSSEAGVSEIRNEVGRTAAHYVHHFDAETIVTLHRTIDAQLAVLNAALDVAVAAPAYPVIPTDVASMALADAILGDVCS